MIKTILQFINEFLTPSFILAIIFAAKARSAVLADNINPDTYLICAIIFMAVWLINLNRKSQ